MILRSTPTVDLSQCDREPIHIPGCIQPHGALLDIDLSTQQIRRVSQNVTSFLGGSPETWLGSSLLERAPNLRAAMTRAVEDAAVLEQNPQALTTLELEDKGKSDLLAHVHEAQLILEVEPRCGAVGEARNLLEETNEIVRSLHQQEDLEELRQALVGMLREMLGYDRVMLYQFGADWHGQVMAESRRDELEPFLGLRYPASDIPAQARELFMRNRVRMIVDIHAPSASLISMPSVQDAPLDLSYATLRAVSPIHIEYLRNMGVRASLSLALQHRGELFGLIACHHYQGARQLAYPVRTAAELIAHAAEFRSAELLAAAENRRRMVLTAELRSVNSTLSEHEDLMTGLRACSPALLKLVDATGFCAWTDGPSVTVGEVPGRERLSQLVQVLEARGEGVFFTDTLAELLPDARELAPSAAGLLALPLSHLSRGWLLWFRPERRRAVTWAGAPEKAIGPGGNDPGVLRPRASFAAWVELVRGRSEPWSDVVIEAVESFRVALSDILYRERNRLSELTQELERRNAELDSFSSMASHDLREPLRGIANYARFLREDIPSGDADEIQSHLNSIDRLVRRMYTLIESLLHFARLGQGPVELEDVSLEEIVADVLEDCKLAIESRKASITVHPSLPTLRTWPLGITEVFANLLSNALKYSDHPPKVEIGVLGEAEKDEHLKGMEVVYVRDQGLGIHPDHHESIFRIFHRLHPDGRYGSSSGIGLPIVRKILERLGCRIWVESAPGAGSTFYFSISSATEEA